MTHPLIMEENDKNRLKGKGVLKRVANGRFSRLTGGICIDISQLILDGETKHIRKLKTF